MSVEERGNELNEACRHLLEDSIKDQSELNSKHIQDTESCVPQSTHTHTYTHTYTYTGTYTHRHTHTYTGTFLSTVHSIPKGQSEVQ